MKFLTVITDNQSNQGTFSEGYETTFETIGSQVKISITLNDKDKSGVAVYLWRETFKRHKWIV